MNDLVDTIGTVLMISGLCLFFVLPFASAWKAHYRKEKISPKSLTRHSLYLGIAVMVFGLGFILSTWQNSDPETWLVSNLIFVQREGISTLSRKGKGFVLTDLNVFEPKSKSYGKLH